MKNNVSTAVSVTPPQLSKFDLRHLIYERSVQVTKRYAEIIERSGIAKMFSDAEHNAFRDCCNGTHFAPAYQIENGVLINFENALEDGIAEKYEIDASATIAMLRELTFTDQVALVEYIERFWRDDQKGAPNDEIRFLNSIGENYEQINDRYSEILSRTDITHMFREADNNALRDCCSSIVLIPAYMFDGEVSGGNVGCADDDTVEEYGVRASDILDKLCTLSYTDLVALDERANQFWCGFEMEDQPEEVGFVSSIITNPCDQVTQYQMKGI
jgi:hypothetical protein